MINNIDITSIEDEVRDIIRGLKVSDRVYSNRPKSTDSVPDFIVAMVSGNVNDMAAFGECIISIHIFAKDVNNIKNGKKLSVMAQKIREGFPIETNRLIFEMYPTQQSDIPDDFGFHRRTIRINTIIKK